jgi:rod shape-determining protein MreD
VKAAVAATAVVLAVLVQAVLVNRLALPGGAAPDLVVLAVTGVALFTGPVAGACTGFAAGLALDLLPPADHELGRGALVLCLAGYAIAAMRAPEKRTGAQPYAVAAAATLGTALLFAFIGLVVGDARFGVLDVLLAATLTLLMTLVVSPLVLWPLTAAMRRLTRESYASFATAPWAGGMGG